jgi:hypothetical protein
MTAAANIIKLKRNTTSGSVPSTSALQDGELALNTADGKLFFKTSTDGGVTYNIATLRQYTAGTNVTISNAGQISATATVSPATTRTLGGVIVGNNISVATDGTISVNLSNYVTSTSLTSTLGSYVTITSLTSTLGSYVTSTSLTSTLGSYATTTALNNLSSLNNNGNSLSLASNGTLTAPGDILVNSLSVKDNIVKTLFLYQDGNLTVKTGTVRWYASAALTVTGVLARVANASDTGIEVKVKKNGLVVDTIELSANSLKSASYTGFSMVTDDYLTVDVTAVGGAQNPGSGLSVQFNYYFT